MHLKTKHLTNNLFLAVFILFFANFLLLSSPKPVSAHSATLNTASSISLTSLSTHDGIAIDEESVNVVTTCHAGYYLSIATSTNPDLYLNGDSTGTATFTAVDGTSTLANSTNKWGYTLTNDASSSTIFSPLSTTASVLKTSSQTASQTDINDTFSIYYGVKAGNTVTPGSYQMANNGSIIYYLTVDPSCETYSIQYNGNNADNPNGMGTTDATTGEKSVQQINVAENTTITLLAPNYYKTGYGFLGWSTDPNAYTHFVDNDNTNDPIIYGPNEEVAIDSTITATANSNRIINFYAVWIPALKDGNNAPIYMQEWDNTATTIQHDGCSTLTATIFNGTITDEKGKLIVSNNSIVALTDKRDNMVYTIARLADGNCWMVENLRLNHQYTMGQNQNDNTVTNQFLSQGYGGTTDTYGNFIGLAEPETSTAFSDSTTSNSVYESSSTLPLSTYDPTNHTLENIGDSTYPGYRFPRYNNSNTANPANSISYYQDYANPSSPSDSGTNYRTSSNIYSYGNYYNWSAAMANTNHYSHLYYSHRTSTSICPAGWHLPSSEDSSGEYNILSRSNGGTGSGQNNGGQSYTVNNRFRSFPNNFLYAGGISISSSSGGRGELGVYWSKTVVSIQATNTLNLDSSGIWPSNPNFHKTNGLPVRCLVNPSEVEVILDSNNGTGAISRVYGTPGNLALLPSSSTAQPEYTFVNWNTAPDGSGTSYTTSYSIPSASTGITLYAQWIAPPRTIQYDGNGADNESTGMGSTDQSTGEKSVRHYNAQEGKTFTLFASNFKRDGYAFIGWSLDADAWAHLTDNDNTNDPKIYGPNEQYTVPPYDGTHFITFYAIWAPALTSGNNPVYLQNWNGCNALTAVSRDATTGSLTINRNSIVALTDQRDNQVYGVAKLVDGTCWMIENLRLNNTPELTTANTNINPLNSSLPLVNDYYNGITSNHLSASSNSWDVYDNFASMEQSLINTDNTTWNNNDPSAITPSFSQDLSSSNPGTPNFYAYSSGNHYNWYSATAGYGGMYTSKQETEGDICPNGWKLPYGDYYTTYSNPEGSFSYLDLQMGGPGLADYSINSFKRWTTFPNNYLFAGIWYDEWQEDVGIRGIYWASGSSSDDWTFADGLAVSYSNTLPTNSIDKNFGSSIRCVINP